MRHLSLTLILFVFIFSIDKKYDDIFNESYYKALDFIDENEQVFIDELGCDKSKRFEKISIIFPELLKYSMYKDILETTALELLYVNYGKEQADFSIGYFQMKPSFIENLESEVLINDGLSKEYSNIIFYKDTNIKEIRRERIRRLKTLNWQLKYLNCFYHYISIQYSNYEWSKTEYRIRFLATAYNHDFRADKKQIEQWIDQKIYPYGLIKGKKQYAYSDIAFFYFKNSLTKNNE